MSRVLVRANIEDAYIEVLIEGWVDEDDWRRACDECAAPMHVTRILSLRVKAVGGGWLPEAAWHAWRSGRIDRYGLETELRRRWLEDDPDWRPHVLGAEITVVRAPGPPPGMAPLLEVDDD